MSEYFEAQQSYAVEPARTLRTGISTRLANHRRAQAGLPPMESNAVPASHVPQPSQLSKPAAKAAPAVPAAPSTMATMFATTAAVAAERKRFADVFASEHSKGRERGCIALLTNGKGWPAAQIVSNLPTLPNDRELAANNPAVRAECDARWARAYAASGVKTTHAAQDANDANDPWTKAYAKIGRK